MGVSGFLLLPRQICDGPQLSGLKNYKFELNKNELAKIQKVFNVFGKDGVVNPHELVETMVEVGLDQKNPVAFELISEFDTPEYSYGLSFDDFVEKINQNLADRESEKAMDRAFQLFANDPTKNQITYKEVVRLGEEVGDDISDEQAKALMNEAAENGINLGYDEFYSVMTKKIK